MMRRSSIRWIAAACITLSCIAFPTFADLNDRLCKSAWYPGLGIIIRLPEPVPGRRLWDAAHSGDLEGVKAALDDGADVHAFGSAWLEEALSGGNLDVVSLLLRRGANADSSDKDGDSQLARVVSASGLSEPYRVSIAGMLIAHGANVRRPNKEGWTPIHHWTASNGGREILDLLLENGADINALDAENRTPLDLVGYLPYPPDLPVRARESADYLLAHGARIGGTSANGKTSLADIDRELFMAAVTGSSDRVRQAVAHGAHVNVRDILSRSPLIRAVQLGRLEAAKALLDNGADFELPEYAGRTPLHAAAAGGFPELVELLLAHGAKINATDQWGTHRTPLGVAADADTAVVLLRAGADANIADRLCPAIFFYDRKLVELLISYGADANQCGDYTPLLTAISFQKWDIANFLLDHGADSNAAGGSASSTPLTLAAGTYGSGITVASLLEHGADLNTPDNIGNTALINAASSGQTDVMKLLLDHGAKVGVKGILGTALVAAGYDLETADLLISHGATVDDWVPGLLGQDARLDGEQRALFKAVATDNVGGIAAVPNSVSKEFPGGLTPLVLAIKLARTYVTDWLLEHGANANERDERGITPLHWAVIAHTREPQRKIALIDSLFKHGASIDVTEVCYGMTPLHFAAALFYKDIVDLLLRNKADPARRTKQGYTPMRLAQRAWAGPGDSKQKAVTIESLRRAVSGGRPIQP